MPLCLFLRWNHDNHIFNYIADAHLIHFTYDQLIQLNILLNQFRLSTIAEENKTVVPQPRNQTCNLQVTSAVAWPLHYIYKWWSDSICLEKMAGVNSVYISTLTDDLTLFIFLIEPYFIFRKLKKLGLYIVQQTWHAQIAAPSTGIYTNNDQYRLDITTLYTNTAPTGCFYTAHCKDISAVLILIGSPLSTMFVSILESPQAATTTPLEPVPHTMPRETRASPHPQTTRELVCIAQEFWRVRRLIIRCCWQLSANLMQTQPCS